ncbi:hypothetical protein [Bryobacter aggregatus]|uniref:hypothetical protein n=1 Tax=Bryobacter aggregatus TaxID=360054 RepID=UPI0004E23D71|nr:hypothetical protein [Bryobacter aggregatus]
MKFLLALLTLAQLPAPQMRGEMELIAKTATVMVDGDLCQRIVTPRALEYMLRNPSRDRWADADNYEVNEAAFVATKKTLMRLARLADFPVDVNLWMPIQPDLTRVHVVIRNRHEMSQFWPWGKLFQDTPEPMLAVLREGKRVTVTGQNGFVSVLAPVRNSLDEIVGLVEVVTKAPLDARENVK